MSGSDPPGANASDPPDVKVAKVEAAGHVALAMAILGGLADLVGLVVFGALIWAHVLPVEPWVYVVLALATGTTVSRMRGGKGHGGGTLGLLVSIAQSIADLGKHG